MTAEEPKEQQRNLWGAAAPAWERWYAFQEVHARPVNEWLCRSASLSAGKTVLDLACGSGEPSFTAAQFVRPGGKVIATDIAPEMVEAVRRRAAADGVDNVEARVMDIEHIDLPDATVDAVTCRWGYMFCPDLRRALDESQRVLRVGGRLSLAVWSLPAANPWLGTFVNVLNQVAPSPTPPDPNALGPFRLADRARLDDLLRSAGFADHSIDTVNFGFDFDSPEQWWEFVFDIAAPIRTRILSLDGSGQERVKQLVLAQADVFESQGKLKLPAQNLCAVASK
jgi:SAM-dependent methyltransferase